MNEPDLEIAALLATFANIKSAEDENELRALDDAVQRLGAVARPERAIEALLGILERFPSGDGYGVFWGILHALETMPGQYESPLVQSIQRQPSEFSLNMLYRIIKDGQTEAGGVDLYHLLEDVSNDSRWSEEIRKDARQSIVALQEYGIEPTAKQKSV